MELLEKLLKENQPLDKYTFDEVGNIGNFLGWYGLLVVSEEYYIVHKLEDYYSIKHYKNKKSINKAWDHICNKYELWYLAQFNQQRLGPFND